MDFVVQSLVLGLTEYAPLVLAAIGFLLLYRLSGLINVAYAETITLGAETNVQEHAMLHTDMGFPLITGRGCTIGHGAILHGCILGDNVLVGMGAIVLNGAKIGAGSLVGAGALVTSSTPLASSRLLPSESSVCSSRSSATRPT